MEYCLPHAVLALLQEENTPRSPKSYFISSSIKTTKITLIYTRQKRETEKAKGRKSKTRISRDRLSSSGTDDYSHRPRSVSRRDYVRIQGRGHNPRICSSTPGRGYNDAASARGRSGGHIGTVKMPTDPLKRSPSKEHFSVNNFASFNAGLHSSDSDLSNHYATMSPRSISDDRPPTPGKNFFSTSSPRPPTPNFNNYSTLLHGSQGEATSRTVFRRSPSRLAAVGHEDNELSPPPTPCIHRSVEVDSNSRLKGKGKSACGGASSTISPPHAQSKSHNAKATVPSIHVKSASPATPPKHRINAPEVSDLGKKPSYHRNQSWDGPNRY